MRTRVVQSPSGALAGGRSSCAASAPKIPSIRASGEGRSTLVMLVAAFAGHELTMRAYREAIDAEYRFYSYGDAMAVV